MIAHILSVGTELTLGQTIDTNAAWLAQELAALGVTVAGHSCVPDDVDAIVEEVRRCTACVGILLVSGGLGPTPDDVTRAAMAKALGVGLELHPPSLEHIRALFVHRGLDMPEANVVQAMIPARTTPLENNCGTAPGIRARIGQVDVFVLPGVPREMREMFSRHVRPELAGVGSGRVILQAVLRTYGMPESELGQRIADLMARGRNPNVGTTAQDAIIGIRVNAAARSESEARTMLADDVSELHRRLGTIIFGEGEATLQRAVAEWLWRHRRTVATAESCTGGLIAKWLTDVPGSSRYFLQGFVTYSNESKQRVLGVPGDLLERHGAVSREVAEALADACRRLSGSDYALSVTGVAGPDGGTAEKPVGLVFLGLAGPDGCAARELRLGPHLTRAEIRDRAAKAALDWLRRCLLKL